MVNGLYMVRGIYACSEKEGNGSGIRLVVSQDRMINCLGEGGTECPAAAQWVTVI